VEAAGWREGDGQGTMGVEKCKEPASFTRRPPFPKKGKEDNLVSSERREEILDQGVYWVDLCRAHREGGHSHILVF